MRTTLTLDDDLNQKLQELAARKRMSFKAVVNNTIREGLRAQSSPGRPTERITLPTVTLNYRTGIDEVKLKEHLDELSLDDFDSQ